MVDSYKKWLQDSDKRRINRAKSMARTINFIYLLFLFYYDETDDEAEVQTEMQTCHLSTKIAVLN